MTIPEPKYNTGQLVWQYCKHDFYGKSLADFWLHPFEDLPKQYGKL